VLTYYGVDRSVLHEDYKYSVKIYERLLIQLAKKLNRLHGLNHSLRFWRIVLGPWLTYFIGIFLDRYHSICVAAASGKAENTFITTKFPEEYLPNDFSGFRARYFRDDYNHCLFSQIIKSLGTIPWEEKNNEGFLFSGVREDHPHQDNSFKLAVIRLLGAYSKLVPDSLQKMVFIQSYIKPTDLINLQLSLKMLPCPYMPRVDAVTSKVDWEMRRDISLGQGENRFEAILEECVPLHMPRVYVEGYSSMAQKAAETYPKNPKVIVTSNAYKAEEGFKFWAAAQVDRGVKLVLTQHGGHVGDGLWSTDDDHEIKIAHRHFTWGWTRESENKVVPMLSSQLAAAKGKFAPDANGLILCVPTSYGRYSNTFFSAPCGPAGLEYFKLQEQFYKMVTPEVHGLLMMRLENPTDPMWEEKLRWRDSDVSPKVYQGNKPFYNHLTMSRCCVCFYNGTPFLETFAANYPTLLCWDPKYTELNEMASPYFDLLRKAGILHDTPESAASKLNNIYQDPLSWWVSPEIQNARNKFCDRFARTNNDWLAQWEGELLKLT